MEAVVDVSKDPTHSLTCTYKMEKNNMILSKVMLDKLACGALRVHPLRLITQTACSVPACGALRCTKPRLPVVSRQNDGTQRFSILGVTIRK